MSKIVLDASALLTLLNQETGHEAVERHLPHAVMSTVNVAEVITVLIDLGVPDKAAKDMVMEIIKEIVPFELPHAFTSASLKKITKPHGLSFGDRACLALAQLKNLPVLTADKIWGKINYHEIKIILIR